jgi:hypothetical protein
VQELGNNLIPIVAIGCTFLTFILWILLATIDSIYKTRCTSRLKERLIERGHSPGEIDQFLRAGQTHDEWGEPVQPVPPVKSTAYPST